jgi:hypothetical protein
MTAGPPISPGPGDRVDNGLLATSYVALTDVAPAIAPDLLTALGRARIPAYLAAGPPDGGTLRLYVAAADRGDARIIIASVVRATGSRADVLGDPLSGIDADAEFASLVADWHVDTHAAIRDAERALTREDEDWRARLRPPPSETEELPWLEDEHYVPPAPPPLPRLAGPTILAVALLAVSIVVLGFGTQFGMPTQLSLLLGVCGVLLGAGLLVMRLRSHRDEDDDGAVL